MTLLPDEKYEIAVSYGTIIGTGVFAIVVCSTKLYIRKFMLNSFGIDDWACLIGLVRRPMFLHCPQSANESSETDLCHDVQRHWIGSGVLWRWKAY